MKKNITATILTRNADFEATFCGSPAAICMFFRHFNNIDTCTEEPYLSAING